MDDRLDGVRLKIKRAEKHLNVLNRSIGHYLDGDPYSLVGKFEPESSEEFVIRIRAKKMIPSDWPVIIGDITHNLRSALDHLAHQLAGPTPPPHTEFPIFLDSKKYNRKGKNRNIIPGSGLYKVRGMTSPARTAIRDLQPYRRAADRRKTASSDPLWLLHELNRVDKHQLPQITAVGVDNYNVRLSANGEFAGGIIGFGRSPLENGAEVWRKTIPGRPHPKVRVESNLTPEITFAQPGAAYGRSVIDVLLAAGDTIVTDVLPKLEPLLPPD